MNWVEKEQRRQSRWALRRTHRAGQDRPEFASIDGVLLGCVIAAGVLIAVTR